MLTFHLDVQSSTLITENIRQCEIRTVFFKILVNLFHYCIKLMPKLKMCVQNKIIYMCPILLVINEEISCGNLSCLPLISFHFIHGEGRRYFLKDRSCLIINFLREAASHKYPLPHLHNTDTNYRSRKFGSGRKRSKKVENGQKKSG